MQAELIPAVIPFPTGAAPRSEGVHLSGLIRSMAADYGFLDVKYVEDQRLVEIAGQGEKWWATLDEDAKIRMGLGLAWEEWYLPKLPDVVHQPGEQKLEGIYMTPDGHQVTALYRQKKWKYTLAVHEVKVTTKSITTVGDLNYFNAKNWLWITQTACNCVHPSTRILTSDLRWVRADTLKIGDELFSFDEFSHGRKSRKYRKTVINNTKTTLQHCYELKLEDGTEVVCSYDHKWLTIPTGAGHGLSWTQTRYLLAEDLPRKHGREDKRICKPLDVWDSPDTFDGGWLGGFFDGEGYISLAKGRNDTRSVVLGGYQNQGIVADRVRSLLTHYGIRFISEIRNRDNIVAFRVRGLPDILKVLGMFKPIRLMNKFSKFNKFPEMAAGSKAVAIKSRRYVGLQPTQMIDTTSGTYFAEGLASHNCKAIQTTLAYLHVLYLYGDYQKPYTPKLHVWRLQFEEKDVNDIWSRVRDYRDQKMVEGALR